jgi:outer membrane protein assembly factor BamB
VRGRSSGDIMYLASLPRSLKVIYRVNASANMHGVLAEPLVEGDFIYLADDSGIYALNRSNGGLVWGVEVYGDGPVLYTLFQLEFWGCEHIVYSC